MAGEEPLVGYNRMAGCAPDTPRWKRAHRAMIIELLDEAGPVVPDGVRETG